MRILQTLQNIGLCTLVIGFTTCQKTDFEKINKVKTFDNPYLRYDTVILAGEFTHTGSSSIKEYGHCYSQNDMPDINSGRTIYSSETANSQYESVITGLLKNETYYGRAYVVSEDGAISYGDPIAFKTYPELVSVNTGTVYTIDKNTVTCSGSDLYGIEILSKGIEYRKSTDTQRKNIYRQDVEASNSLNFSITIPNLEAGTSYSFRAYVRNKSGYGYGQEVKYTTLGNNGDVSSVTDYDGNTYSTIVIGNQEWMSENLKTTHYVDGTSLARTSSHVGSSENSRIYYIYPEQYDGSRVSYLYTYYSAVNSNAEVGNENPSGVQGVCPSGWHFPSDAEWQELEMYLGMSQEEANTIGARSAAIGIKLKDGGSSGLNLRYSGAYVSIDDINNTSGINSEGYFWTSQAYYRRIETGNNYIHRYGHDQNMGMSVRCVRN